MRRTIILSLAAATVSTTAWCGSASAQGIGVEIYAGPRAYEYSDYGYRPRVYDYTRRDYNTEAELEGDYPRRSGGCGTYRYWNGDRCVDARNRR